MIMLKKSFRNYITVLRISEAITGQTNLNTDKLTGNLKQKTSTKVRLVKTLY